MSERLMDRRSFLEFWKLTDRPTSANRVSRLPLSTGLEPFIPDANHPWDAVRAGHLLRRTTMMPTASAVRAMVALGEPGKAVDQLLTAPSAPAAPACAESKTESTEGLDVLSRGLVIGQWNADGAALRAWWVDLLSKADTSIIEKMTLFWSSHFTTKFVEEEAYVIAPLLYRQNKLLRDHALGNLKDLVNGITLDGAMLVFLGGNTNSKGHPNENFARELMELYTAGLGWYTEGDIQNAARILTGWRIAQFTDQPAPNGMFNVYFDPNAHDTEAKLFISTPFPARDSTTNTEYLVRKEEIQKLIDTLFEKRAEAIATFICRKLYRFFVYSDPSSSDSAVVSAMAALLIQNNFEIKPVMSALLKSAHFYDNANIGAQIKTPSEFAIGLSRQLGVAINSESLMSSSGQQLFEPPNVSGWPGYHDWVTTSTYPIRSMGADNAVQALSDTAAIDFVNQFDSYDNANALAEGIAHLLLPRPLSTARKTKFVQLLTAGAPDYEWPNILASSPATAARNVRDLLKAIVALPDYYLC